MLKNIFQLWLLLLTLTLALPAYAAKEKEQVKLEELTEKAESGNAQAQYDLGILYYVGRDMEKNLEKGAEWLLKAANQGHPEAQYATGRC